MTCGGCGNSAAYRVRMTFSKEGRFECCDRCGYVPNEGIPDVFWDGKAEHGLPDDPRTGKPMVFSSKRDKAIFLKSNGLVEAGDKINGAPASVLRFKQPPENAREKVMEALHHVRKMGKEYRRQEFLRIVKETQNVRSIV